MILGFILKIIHFLNTSYNLTFMSGLILSNISYTVMKPFILLQILNEISVESLRILLIILSNGTKYL